MSWPAWFRPSRSFLTAAVSIVVFNCDVLRGGDGECAAYERMAEWTIVSAKAYADPFNDVEVNVVFERNGKSWRVPTFWRGSTLR